MTRSPLSCFISGISQPLPRYDERFFMPLIRAYDCRVDSATRNEDWPGSLTVQRNEGNRKNRKK